MRGKRKDAGMESTVEPLEQEKPKAFPSPVLTVEQWAECRRCVEAGLEMKEAAEKFGVDYQTVKQRAYREKWLHDSRIKALAEQVKAKEAAKVVNLSPTVTFEQKPVLTASQAIAETFESHRSGTLLNLAKLAGKGIQRAIDANLEIENWQDAKIAADIAMKLHNVGQDSVQVNIAQAFAGMDEGPIVSIDEIEDERDNETKLYFIDNE